ncbi:MAG TPA: carbon monoxide dehydrogenase [Candidatus Marinimicrobia bacterium]|jgi:carbon monoxide dehydrogenase subunit G|nr:carbon monoxide dehydrogenase [Candidatus Neomarinimicrobiota bacterium]
MKVKMTKNFTIGAPIGDVWDFMTDIEKVSSCIPGAKYVEDLDDNCHAVMLTIKVGPIKSSYKSEVSIRNLDVNNHTLEIEGRGIDVKGKGGATMEMVGSLTDSGDGTTEINGDSTVTIQGMLAQFGSRMVEDVSNQLFLQFTKSLAAKLEGNGEQADETESSNETLSGVAVVGAAIKGVSGRLMDKFKKKED